MQDTEFHLALNNMHQMIERQQEVWEEVRAARGLFQVLGYYLEISTQLNSHQKRRIAIESTNQRLISLISFKTWTC